MTRSRKFLLPLIGLLLVPLLAACQPDTTTPPPTPADHPPITSTSTPPTTMATTSTTSRPRTTTTIAPTTKPATAVPPTTKAPTTTTPSTNSGGRWVPTPGTSWQLQLDQGTPSPILDVQVYDIDYQTPNIKSVISSMHAKGIKVLCYVPSGNAEDYRNDWAQFQGHIGNAIDGWPSERWININDAAVKPLLAARYQSCKDNGADGVDPDEIEAYAAGNVGFSATYQDQLNFNRWLADTVHSMGMSVTQKSDTMQIKDLEPWFDAIVQEQCYEQNFCADMTPYLNAGKAVFEAEYTVPSATQCADAKSKGISLIIKKLALDAWRQTC